MVIKGTPEIVILLNTIASEGLERGKKSERKALPIKVMTDKEKARNRRFVLTFGPFFNTTTAKKMAKAKIKDTKATCQLKELNKFTCLLS